jgi:hypothetical protein
MNWTKEEKTLRNSTAESLATLAIGTWTIVLIGYTTSISNDTWANYYSNLSWINYLLAALGGVFVVLGLYLMLCWDWKQKSVLTFLERTKTIGFIKLIGWLIILVIFALGLVQTGNVLLYLIGMITFLIAFIIFFIGLFKINKT